MLNSIISYPGQPNDSTVVALVSEKLNVFLLSGQQTSFFQCFWSAF